MVSRSINGKYYDVDLNDVQKTKKYFYPPEDAAGWDAWFKKHGTPQQSGNDDGMNALDRLKLEGAFNSAHNNNISVAQSATLAGPLLVMMARTVLWGLIEKYAGGKVIGIVVNAGGTVFAKIIRQGKEILVELSDDLAKQVRLFVKKAADEGSDDAARALKQLRGVAPRPIPSLPKSAAAATKVAPNSGKQTFRDILTPAERSEFEALRAKYPDWMPKGGLDTPATVRSVFENAAARSEFTGRGHHRHPLKFGGEPNPPDLVPTGETRKFKNPTHTDMTNWWNKVLRRITAEGSGE